jgi:hypothetical protein
VARSGKGGRRPNYGSKRRVNTQGYVEVYEPDHPLAMSGGYVLESRKVAWDAGLLTDPTDHVHHGPGGRLDNRLENLTVMTPAQHARHHHLHEQETYDRMRARVRQEMGERSCEVCGADITAKRIDAVVCGNTCRITRWKAGKAAAAVARSIAGA